MNITNFTKRELAAYERYQARMEGRWTKGMIIEEIVGGIAFVALFIALVAI